MAWPLGDLAGAVGVGGQLVGGVVQSRAAQAQGRAAADAADYNARLALREGLAEADRRRKAGRREIARQRVSVAASDLRVEGSPLEVIAANAAAVEEDAANAEIDARRTARLERARADSFREAGRTSAGVALLSGATGALQTGYSLWSQRRTRGY